MPTKFLTTEVRKQVGIRLVDQIITVKRGLRCIAGHDPAHDIAPILTAQHLAVQLRIRHNGPDAELSAEPEQLAIVLRRVVGRPRDGEVALPDALPMLQRVERGRRPVQVKDREFAGLSEQAGATREHQKTRLDCEPHRS